MQFLLDTNILIGAEPTRADDVERRTPVIAGLLGAISRGNHGMWLHPASIGEIKGDKDEERRNTRLLLLAKYPELQFPPRLSVRLSSILGVPEPGSHNEIDMLLLSALDADAVDYFVTDDGRLHKRAHRVGLATRVLDAAEALATIRGLFPTVPTPPPHVVALPAHALRNDPIFATLRIDYPGFDQWLAKCKREQRRAWAIESQEQYAGICIVKDENLPGDRSSKKALKLCTFKVSDAFRGLRYGELLLKTVFAFIAENNYAAAFVDVFPRHEHLVRLFEDFGFHCAETKSNGELVMTKSFCPESSGGMLDPLDFNITYGPFALKMSGARTFVVPIQPRFHQLLFPESEQQLQLRTEVHPFGNSIRKAYLCHAALRQMKAGDVLLFYCSQITQAVTAVGVVEGTLTSQSAAAIARYVGKRTVYPYVEIEKMAERPVLAILFRLSRFVPGAWPLDLLLRVGILRSAPQSIVRVQNSEALTWIAEQLSVSQ